MSDFELSPEAHERIKFAARAVRQRILESRLRRIRLEEARRALESLDSSRAELIRKIEELGSRNRGQQ